MAMDKKRTAGIGPRPMLIFLESVREENCPCVCVKPQETWYDGVHLHSPALSTVWVLLFAERLTPG
jgi:hypothetical protein